MGSRDLSKRSGPRAFLRLHGPIVLGIITLLMGAGCGAPKPQRGAAPEFALGAANASPVAPSAVSSEVAGVAMESSVPDTSPVITNDVTFPPRDEPFNFRRDSLERKYQLELRRPPTSSFVDVEGTIVWTQEYLRYRVNGCGHQEAIDKVLLQIRGAGVQPVCRSVTGNPIFPPRNEPFDFRQVLERVYRDELRRGAVQTFVDVEGDIVWTQEYLRYRVSSCSHADAVTKVLTQIDGGGVQRDCGPPIGGGDGGGTGGGDGSTLQCTYSLSPATATLGASAATGSFIIGAGSNCSWSATSNASFITITSGSRGTGSGTVGYSVTANTGTSSRTGTITVGSQTFTITQGAVTQDGTTPAPCTYALSTTGTSVVAGGGAGTFAVTTQAGCAWTATSNSAFITVTSGANGNGAGTVGYSVAANSSTSVRSGTITAGGQTFTVSQNGTTPPACTYVLSPTSASVPAAGNTGSFTVTTQAGCAWAASSGSAFVTVTSGANGTGTGTVGYSVAANSATAARSGTITAGGQTYTVNQEGMVAPTCTYTLSPTSVNVAAGGGTSTFTVSTQTGCTWTAASNSAFVNVTSGSSGTGSGSVGISVAANSGAARTGNITAAGQTFTINQVAVTLSSTFNITPNGATSVNGVYNYPGGPADRTAGLAPASSNPPGATYSWTIENGPGSMSNSSQPNATWTMPCNVQSQSQFALTVRLTVSAPGLTPSSTPMTIQVYNTGCSAG